MVTLHEMLYLMGNEVDVAITVHHNHDVIGSNFTRAKDTIYAGEAGEILRRLTLEKSDELSYAVSIPSGPDEGEIRLEARKHEDNVYSVKYKTRNDNYEIGTITAANYNLAHNMAAQVVQERGFKDFWIRLEKGIG